MRALLLSALLVGCIDPVDARWQLDHDHVVAARATPPRIRTGEATNIDALVARDGGTVGVEDPMSAELGPDSAGFARYLVQDNGAWRLEAPDAATIAGARPALGLEEGDPVPVDIMLTFARSTNRASIDPFRVKKTVWLGEPRPNPELPPPTIDGALAPAEGEPVEIPLERDVYLAIGVPDGVRVNWLTNVGTLFQDDLASAYMRVLPDDRRDGELVVVIRDAEGGVAWRVWPLRAQ